MATCSAGLLKCFTLHRVNGASTRELALSPARTCHRIWIHTLSFVVTPPFAPPAPMPFAPTHTCFAWQDRHRLQSICPCHDWAPERPSQRRAVQPRHLIRRPHRPHERRKGRRVHVRALNRLLGHRLLLYGRDHHLVVHAAVQHGCCQLRPDLHHSCDPHHVRCGHRLHVCRRRGLP